MVRCCRCLTAAEWLVRSQVILLRTERSGPDRPPVAADPWPEALVLTEADWLETEATPALCWESLESVLSIPYSQEVKNVHKDHNDNNRTEQ